MKTRIDRLMSYLVKLKLDAILISNPSNIYYISGFRGTDSYCLISHQAGNFIITDFRYAQQAEKEADGFEIITIPDPLFKKTIRLIKKKVLKKVGFESHHLTFKEVEVIGDGTGMRLLPTFQLIEKQRILKEPQEIEIIKKAAQIAKGALDKVAKGVKEGKSEKDVAIMMDYSIRVKGAEAPAFETIVASGSNASIPHAKPTRRKLRRFEPVIIDCGARVKGYNSDLTRTLFIDKIGKSFKLLYSIVRDAQQMAIDKIKPGVKISEVDSVARGYIDKKGFGKYFGHATGHGIGIDIHELPSINSRNYDILKDGMVFTIEPAIYIPGCGGVRIEDMVMVTEKRRELLTI